MSLICALFPLRIATWSVAAADWTLCRPVCSPVSLQPSLYYYSCKCASPEEICLQFTWIKSVHPALPLEWPNGLFVSEVLLLANHSLSAIYLLSHWEPSKRAFRGEVTMWKVPHLHSLAKQPNFVQVTHPSACMLCSLPPQLWPRVYTSSRYPAEKDFEHLPQFQNERSKIPV